MIEALLLAASFGCGGTPMTQQLPPGRYRDRAPEIDTLGVSSYVGRPAGRVWTVLPAVFKDLGLEINYRVPEEHRTGTCYQKVRSRLGPNMLSDLLDCGETRSLPNADRYEIGLTVIVTLEPQSEGTAVHTFVLGVGLDDSGVASERIWCRSKGVIEQRIDTMIQAQLASG